MTTLTPTGPVKMSGEVLKTKTLILTQEMNLQSIGESEADAGHLLLLRCTERSCSPRSEDSQHPHLKAIGSNPNLPILARGQIKGGLNIPPARLLKKFSDF